MREITLRAFAKINLGLDVLRRRDDGYHDLRMIMQSIRLSDRLTMRMTRAEGVRISTNLSYLPGDADNLASRAASMLMEEFDLPGGVYIDLEKHIPVAAGLAGGSSDAAAAMVGINRLFDLKLSLAQLMERGKAIGADVPFCLMRGTALAEGIGEKLTPLPSPPACLVLLAKPDARVSTKYVYTNLDLAKVKHHPDIDAQIAALKKGDLEGLAAGMGNVLEPVTQAVCPDVRLIREEMLEKGAVGAMMSGSGPTVFGLFTDKEKAMEAKRSLEGRAGMQRVILCDLFLTDHMTGSWN